MLRTSAPRLNVMSNTPQRTEVVTAFLRHAGRILLLRRSDDALETFLVWTRAAVASP